jgi:hypothetical protein
LHFTLKKILPQILSSFIVSLVTGALILKFQSRIETLTEKQTLVVSVVLLGAAAIVLAVPSIIAWLNRSRQAKANLIGWGFLIYIYVSIIVFATLTVTALLFLASTKLPTRENLPYYLVNVGPCLGLIGVISHILLNAGRYIAYETNARFFDVPLGSDIANFALIAWLIYAFPDKPINPIITFCSIGLGTASFMFAFGTFTGTFHGFNLFLKDLALEMREKDAQLKSKDDKLKLYARIGRPHRKRRK